ncbi:MAG: 23S rRNA (uracil(1939)-C(5))-methyltransferase RlmD [Gammaproteobacteria bacterium]|nr:23S rRNA (uracil(1939)-C(5))-methyltransferase RlmD [Gammaproteobacteria bacterium]
MKKKSRARAATGGDAASATVASFSHDGRGVARLQGKAIFIDGALPGERVHFRYLNKHKSYDEGEVIDILESSPNRVQPPCPHFGICGGCGWQHLRPEIQIQAKQKILAEQLARLGKVTPETWLEPIKGPSLAYRRRARLGVRQISDRAEVVIGFRQKRKSFIADLNTCLVLDPKISNLLPAVRLLISSLSCPNRIPQVEIAGGDGAVENKIFAFIFRHLVALTENDKQLLRDFGQQHDIQIYLQASTPTALVCLWPDNPAPLYYRLPEFNIEIRFGPTDFVQINSAVNQAMVSQAVKLLDIQRHDKVLDLFCGLGNFTLPLARQAKQVLGVEVDAALVERARQNATLNAITNAEFMLNDLYQESATPPPWVDFHCDKLLLDPPRNGAMEAIKALAEPLPTRIVYVSCYPATLARDSQYLVEKLGYRLAAIGALDMFPHTNHVESMALFIKNQP